jgi:BirA family biotin operon repressor/biotin-[acetyl-CoA-carboxylase] ligase
VGGTCLDDLRQGSDPVDRRHLLALLLEALVPRRAQLDEPGGRRLLADEVRRRSDTLGREVRVTLGPEVLSGRATTLDDQGRLVVETPGGIRAVSAGDVVHVRPGESSGPDGPGAHAAGG